MKIDLLSDLHGHLPILDGGDLLIIAGDLTARDTLQEYEAFKSWCARQPYSKVVCIAGNHDTLLEQNPHMLAGSGVVYLLDSSTVFSMGDRSVSIYGSPWTTSFPGMNPRCMAYTVPTDKQLSEKWKSIPDGVDILVTHSPPFGILDAVEHWPDEIEHVGSKSLLDRIREVRPLLHLFGHIHEGHGTDFVNYEVFCGEKEIMCVNASYVDGLYRPVHSATRIEL